MSEVGQSLPPCPHCGAAHPEEVLLCPVTHRLLPLEGRVLDRRFRFVRMLGEGGMSTVWMAENVRVRKHVAIKLMHPEYARNPRTLHRFQNEATAAGRIGNPHICDILDFGESPLGPYMVMEMLRGQSFADLLESQGKIDPPLAVLIIREALKGLGAAHAAGIIHRDLKPENVFLHEPEPGRMLVKLMDFGISKFTEDTGGGRTGANVIMGTPEYMAPEQAAGAANVDARTDIWAMGVMLYRALAGIEPFKGKTMAALLVALSTENPTSLHTYTPGLPQGLVAIVERCLSKKPEGRYANTVELYDALAPYQQAVAVGERPVAPPVPVDRSISIAIDPMTIGGMDPAPGMSMPPTAVSHPPAGATVVAPSHPPAGATVVAGMPPVGMQDPALAPTQSGNPQWASAPGPNPSPQARAVPPPARNAPTGPGTNEGATWSTELDPKLGPAEQSWTTDLRTFSEDETRPHEPRRKSGWVGWVIGVSVAGLLIGGGVFAWSAGLFGGKSKTKASDDAVAAADDDSETPADLPGGTSSSTSEGTTSEGTTSEGTTSEGSTSEGSTSEGSTSEGSTGEPATGDDEGSTSSTSSGGSSSGGSSGGSSSGGSSSGGSSSGGGDDGDDTGGGSHQPSIQLAKLHQVGSLYTPKELGPSGTWSAANAHCKKLKSSKKFGLSGWRMASTAEIATFKAKVDKLQFWGSETSGAQAKTIALLNSRVVLRPQTDSGPRAFCVSKH
ncbi:serine/threonine protein kinase [Nannocystaceae bacterium ST9]